MCTVTNITKKFSLHFYYTQVKKAAKGSSQLITTCWGPTNYKESHTGDILWDSKGYFKLENYCENIVEVIILPLHMHYTWIYQFIWKG